MGNPVYDQLSTLSNLPRNSTLHQYDTLDNNASDGISHQTLADMQHDFDKNSGFTDKFQAYNVEEVWCVKVRYNEGERKYYVQPIYTWNHWL